MDQKEFMKKRRKIWKEDGKCIRCGFMLHPKSKLKKCESCRAAGEAYKKENKEKFKGYIEKKQKAQPIRKLKNYGPINSVQEKEELYQIMINRKITTKSLAEVIGVSQRTVERWLFDEKAMPNEMNQLKLNNYLERSIFK